MRAKPDGNLKRLLREEERAPDTPEKRRLKWVTFLGPIIATVVLLALAWVFSGPEKAFLLIGWAVAIFTVMGKFAVLAGVGGDSLFNPWELATLVVYMDVMIATVLVLNLPRLYRVPGFGPALEDLAEHGLHLLETRRWLGRITFLGVSMFVMFPLTGTGAIGGSIFGRLLGLSARRTLAAIAIGSMIGSFTMAAFAGTLSHVFTRELRNSWQFQAVGLSVLVVVVGVLWWRYKKLTETFRKRRAAEHEQAANMTRDAEDG